MVKKPFDFLKKFDPTPANALKVSGAVILVLVAVAFVWTLFSGLLTGNYGVRAVVVPSLAPAPGGYGGYYDEAVSQSAKGLSIAPMPPRGGGTVGEDAEEFEAAEYSATIETRDAETTCAAIFALKTRDYVIFERSNEHDRGCSYAFKVRKENAAEILKKINELDPKELNESIYTIKRVLEDFDTEEEILRNKLEVINDTLRNAVSAYDEITSLAVRTENAETLAKIIESKLRTIERLTQESVNVSNQLDYLGKAKAESLDRLYYTYFYISVFENRFVEWNDLMDSWKAAVRKFVRDINGIVQDMTINLAVLVLLVLQYALYLLIILVVAKYGWQLVKTIWNK